MIASHYHGSISRLMSPLLPRLYMSNLWNQSIRFEVMRSILPRKFLVSSHITYLSSFPSAISLNIPGWIENLWDSVLRAVPKKKTSHSKKRSRQRAGKALKDVISLNKCSGCGHVKRFHVLCPYCVKGASSIGIYPTNTPEPTLSQTLTGAHKLGCHHIATSRNGKRAVSVGFGGETKVWCLNKKDEWIEEGSILDQNKTGDIWAIALSYDGQYLACTSYDGRINVWDLKVERKKIREFETSGSFGMCIDVSRDGNLTASGHENGAIYVFNNETGKMVYSLPGLVKPVRTIAFSPDGSRLAAAGDASVIALYDVKFGEQIGNLIGHSTWIFSIDWNETGEYLLSGSSDGKVKVWSANQRTCIATHGEAGKTLWCVKWLPKIMTGSSESEKFITAGASRSISIYREATGGG